MSGFRAHFFSFSKNLALVSGLLAFVCFLFFAPQTRAANGINRQINYQAKLLDSSGDPVANGTYSVVFSIYTASSGGTPVWTAKGTLGSPAALSVSVASGFFTVLLGDTSAGGGNQNPLDDSVDWNNNGLYLGVTVGVDAEMTPRKRLSAAPYAFNAEQLQGMYASGTAFGANALFTIHQTSNTAGTGTRAALLVRSEGTSNGNDLLIRGINDLGSDVFVVNRQGSVTSSGIMAITGSGTSTISDALSITGSVVLGSNSSDVLSANGVWNTSFIPLVDGLYGLGSAALRWNGLFVNTTSTNATTTWLGFTTASGTTLNSLNLTAQHATSVWFGFTTASGTTLNALNVTGNNLTSQNVTISGGTINGTTIGATSPSTAVFTNVTSSNWLGFALASGTSLYGSDLHGQALILSSTSTASTPFQVYDSSGGLIGSMASSSIVDVNPSSGNYLTRYNTSLLTLGDGAGNFGAIDLRRGSGTTGGRLVIRRDTSNGVGSELTQDTLFITSGSVTSSLQDNSFIFARQAGNTGGVFTINSSGNVSASGTLRVYDLSTLSGGVYSTASTSTIANLSWVNATGTNTTSTWLGFTTASGTTMNANTAGIGSLTAPTLSFTNGTSTSWLGFTTASGTTLNSLSLTAQNATSGWLGFTTASGTTLNALNVTGNNLTSQNVTISGGTINGTTIGATNASTGVFTSVTSTNTTSTWLGFTTASGTNVNTINLNSSNVALTGGTINNVAIGGTTPSTGIFTNVTSTNTTSTWLGFTTASGTTMNANTAGIGSLTAPTLSFTNGTSTSWLGFTTASGTTLNSLSLTAQNATSGWLGFTTASGTTLNALNVTGNNLTSQNVTISGGTINGTTIGATSPSTAVFTNVTSSNWLGFALASGTSLYGSDLHGQALILSSTSTASTPFQVYDSSGGLIGSMASSSGLAIIGGNYTTLYNTSRLTLGDLGGNLGTINLRGANGGALTITNSNNAIGTQLTSGGLILSSGSATTTWTQNSLIFGAASGNTGGVFTINSSGNVSASGTLRVYDLSTLSGGVYSTASTSTIANLSWVNATGTNTTSTWLGFTTASGTTLNALTFNANNLIWTNATGTNTTTTNLAVIGSTTTTIANSLTVGTSTYQGGLNALFAMNGDDLLVNGNIGSVSSVYTNGAFVAGTGSTYFGNGLINKTDGNLTLNTSGGFITPSSDLGVSLGSASLRYQGYFGNATATNVTTTSLYLSGILKTANNILAASAPSSTSFTQTTTTIESTNDVGRFPAATIGKDGIPIIAYYDNTNGDLRVLTCGEDVSCVSGGSSVQVDGTGVNVGKYASIAIGSDGYPVIAYQDITNGSLKVAHCTAYDCSSAGLTTVDAVGGAGAYTSIAIGGDGYPIIAYQRTGALDAYVVHCTNIACTTKDNPFDIGIGGVNEGYYSRIAIVNGLAMIVQYNSTAQDVLLRKCSNIACSAVVGITIEATLGAGSGYMSVAISRDGIPVFVYYKYNGVDDGKIRVARCTTIACTAVTAIDIETVMKDFPVGNGAWTSVAIGANGLPSVAFEEENAGTAITDPRLITCGNLDCSSGNVAAINFDGATDYIDGTSLIRSQDGSLIAFVFKGGSSANLVAARTCASGCAGFGAFTGSSIGSPSNFFYRIYGRELYAEQAYLSGFDLAEAYPTEDKTLTPGDVLAYDELHSGKVVKADRVSASRMIGVVSTKPGLLLSEWAGRENTTPVALSGRVPVKVSVENGAILVGDALTLSATKPGYAMKATKPGTILGRALEMTMVEGSIETFIHVGYDATALLKSDGSLVEVQDRLVMGPEQTATATSTAKSSWGLSFRGSAWDGSGPVSTEFVLQNSVMDATTTRFTISSGTSTLFSLDLQGAAEFASDVSIGGKFYPSARGALQHDTYLFVDNSQGPTSTYIATNGAGWQSDDAYDFAERYYSPDKLEPGDLVVVSDRGRAHVQRSLNEKQMLIGIVSTKPGFVAGRPATSTYPIALVGRVPTHVSTIRGAIHTGDLLAPSTIPGVAVKAIKAGPVVGQALEDWSGADIGSIEVMVNPVWWGGEESMKTLTNESTDAAVSRPLSYQGFALVAAGATKVHVSFPSLASFPNVQATPRGQVDGGWWTDGYTDVGFDLILKQAQTHDVVFGWKAEATQFGETMFLSDGTTAKVDSMTGVIVVGTLTTSTASVATSTEEVFLSSESGSVASLSTDVASGTASSIPSTGTTIVSDSVSSSSASFTVPTDPVSGSSETTITTAAPSDSGTTDASSSIDSTASSSSIAAP